MLVELAESDDAWLRDLRAASTRCLALLSTTDALKARLADAGVLPLLCHAGARPPGEEFSCHHVHNRTGIACGQIRFLRLLRRAFEAGGHHTLDTPASFTCCVSRTCSGDTEVVSTSILLAKLAC